MGMYIKTRLYSSVHVQKACKHMQDCMYMKHRLYTLFSGCS